MLKATILFIGLAFGWVLLPTVLQYVDSENITDIYKFANLMQGQNSTGGSSINISEYGTFFQFFSFLFRPLFENLNIAYLIASFDNLAYLLIFIWIVLNMKYINFKDHANIYLILTFFTFSLLLGYTIANIGLALRQKIMIMPFLVIVFAHVIARKKLINEST